MNVFSTRTISGLGTTSFVIEQATKEVSIRVKLSLPELNTGASSPSQVVVSIDYNGNPPFYIGEPGATGAEINDTGTLALAVGDRLNIVLSSSDPVDQLPNVIKGVATYSEGF